MMATLSTGSRLLQPIGRKKCKCTLRRLIWVLVSAILCVACSLLTARMRVAADDGEIDAAGHQSHRMNCLFSPNECEQRLEQWDPQPKCSDCQIRITGSHLKDTSSVLTLIALSFTGSVLCSSVALLQKALASKTMSY